MGIDVKDLGEEIDKSILEDIKNNILLYLSSKNLIDEPTIKKRFDTVLKLSVSQNLFTKYKSYMMNVAVIQKKDGKLNYYQQIVVDKQFSKLDKLNKVIGISDENPKYIKCILGHELIHSASNNGQNIGIKFTENERALNEGLTQMYTEKIFNISFSPHMDPYKQYKMVAYLIEATLGESLVAKAYFKNLPSIKYISNNIAKNEFFYDDINHILQRIIDIKSYSLNSVYCDYMIKTLKEYEENLYKKIIIELVIPFYNNLDKNIKNKYLEKVYNAVNNDEILYNNVIKYIKKCLTLSNNELFNEKINVNKNLRNANSNCKILKDINDDNLSNFEINKETQQIFYKSKPPILIEDNLEKEHILSKLYNKTMFNEGGTNYEKYKTKIIEICKKNYNLWTSNALQTNDKDRYLSLMRFAYFKHIARQQDYIVLNSLEDYKKDVINLDIVNIAKSETSLVSVFDLKKIYNKLDLGTKDNHVVVIDKETNEEITDERLCNCFLFIKSWIKANSDSYKQKTKADYFEEAFSVENTKLYYTLSRIMKKCLQEKGTYNIKELYEELKPYEFNNIKEKLCVLFENQHRNEIMYQFYKMQCPRIKKELELPKLANETFYGENYIKDIEEIYQK